MFPRFAPVLGLMLLSGCVNSSGRTKIPQSEAHYQKTVAHQLVQRVAFTRTEHALEDSYDDFREVLQARQPETFTLSLEPTVTYRTGGPMGPTRHAKYTLQVIVGERAIDFAFELGPEPETGHFAPEDAIPYIRNDFETVIGAVEKAVRAP